MFRVLPSDVESYLTFPQAQHALPNSNTKKSHEMTDVRSLTGAEIAQRALKAREAKARQVTANRERATVTPDKEDEGQMLAADTPPRPRQVFLPIRSLEALRSRPGPVFCLFPDKQEASTPPASTAPAELAEEEGRGKRKRASTAKYQQSTKDGLLKKFW
jgi:hypothetical protein